MLSYERVGNSDASQVYKLQHDLVVRKYKEINFIYI